MQDLTPVLKGELCVMRLFGTGKEKLEELERQALLADADEDTSGAFSATILGGAVTLFNLIVGVYLLLRHSSTRDVILGVGLLITIFVPAIFFLGGLVTLIGSIRRWNKNRA